MLIHTFCLNVKSQDKKLNMKKNPILFLVICLVFSSLTGCDKKDQSQKHAFTTEEPTSKETTMEPKDVEDLQKLSEKREPGARLPKQKFPNIVIPPDQPNLVGERLKREFSGLDPKSAEFRSLTLKLWNENLNKLVKEPLQSSSNLEVANGYTLPFEYKSWKVTNPNSDSPENMINGLGLMVLLSGDDLMIDLIKLRSDIIPPSEVDFIIFKSMSTALDEIRQVGTVSNFEKWKELSASRNPLYRLLALKAARRSVTQSAIGVSPESPDYNRLNAQPKLGFYLGFLAEKDLIILTEAISAIATIPTPDAKIALEKFENLQMQNKNTYLAQLAKEALRTQKIMAESFQ